jgi:CRP-like cAMP-binding protein
MSGRTKLWYLKNIDIFSHLREEEYRMLDQHASMREIKKGEALYLYGSSDKKLYMLKKGAVKITKLTLGGRELIIDIIKGGSMFGEMAAIDDRERDEAAVVVEDGLLCELSRPDFERMQNMVPGLALQVTTMIGIRRLKLENKLIDLLYASVEQRLARTIVNLLHDFAVPHADGYLLKIKLTHQDFADLIASTRETVTATLTKWKHDGMVDTEERYLVIPDLQRFKQLGEIA